MKVFPSYISYMVLVSITLKNSYNSVIRQIIFKLAKDLNNHFFKNDTQWPTSI